MDASLLFNRYTMINISADELSVLDKFYRINLINSLTGYKSLNLLGTLSEDGKTNVCVVSSVFHLGSNPPLFGLIIRPEREHNDTLRNIRSSGQYTLNNVLPAWFEAAHQTSASYPSGVSEFAECGFTEFYTTQFKAPFVKESAVKIGLQLRETIDLAINGTTLVIGEVKHIFTADDIIGDDGFLDPIKAGSVTVAGLDSYYQTQPLGRLSYAKPGVLPRKQV